MDETPVALCSAAFADLSARQFHEIVRLRLSVFVVEQACVYAELDGRDTRPDTLHMWIERHGEIASYLRLYPGDEGADWIGRVVTAPAHRRRGLAAQLMRGALDRAEPPVRISAQAHLAGWYERFGFVACGPDFDEDGI